MPRHGRNIDNNHNRREQVAHQLAPGYPDDRDLNAAQLSLEQFCHKANRLYIALQNSSEADEAERAKLFNQFVLAGRTRNRNGVPGHITVNACQGLVDIDEFAVTRDYDSMIGTSKDLPFTTHLELLPVPPFKLTLSSPNHLNGLSMDNGARKLVPMHTIPNFAFAKIATRAVVRVFFPRLYRVNDTPAIPSTDMELIYNHCLRPLVQQHLPNMYTHWPASYSTALILYRDNQGQIHPGSLDVPVEVLPAFGEQYLTRLAELKPYFRDAYFVHEFRGWKGTTVHDPYNPDDRQAALDKLFGILDWPRIKEADWHIDIGFEIGVPGSVVTWRHTGHRFLLSLCLPSIVEADINTLLDRKTEVDHQMHLKDLTGFRCQPGRRGSTDKVSYIQAYTTEKTMSYQLHKGLFTPLDPIVVLTNSNLEDTVKKIARMSQVIFACSGDRAADNDSDSEEDRDPHAPQDGTARVEVRVALEHAVNVLIRIPDDVADYSIVAIPSRYWWYFKWYRLAAVNSVLNNMAASIPRDRQSDSAIGLAGLAIWILNGLHRRPDPRFNLLAQDACQHVAVNADLDEFQPLMYDAGLYFVADVVADINHTFRLPFHKAISDESIKRAFKKDLQEIRGIMGVGSALRRPATAPDRTANRSARVTLCVADIRPADRPLPQINDRLLQNVQLHPPVAARGADVDHFRIHGGGTRDAMVLVHAPEDAQDISQVIQNLLEQLYHDILQESPNPRDSQCPAWTNIPNDLRPVLATENLYKSFALPFRAVQYTFCSEEEWSQRFNHFFPLQLPNGRVQNFRKCRYFQDWMKLVNNGLMPASLQRVRATLQIKFNELIWVPFTASDRMWDTRSRDRSRNWFHLPQQGRWEGPQIAYSPYARRHDPQGAPVLRPAPNDPEQDIVGCQEEEEESDIEELQALLNRQLSMEPRQPQQNAHGAPRRLGHNSPSRLQQRQQQAVPDAWPNRSNEVGWNHEQRQHIERVQRSAPRTVQNLAVAQELREEEEESSDNDLYA